MKLLSVCLTSSFLTITAPTMITPLADAKLANVAHEQVLSKQQLRMQHTELANNFNAQLKKFMLKNDYAKNLAKNYFNNNFKDITLKQVRLTDHFKRDNQDEQMAIKDITFKNQFKNSIDSVLAGQTTEEGFPILPVYSTDEVNFDDENFNIFNSLTEKFANFIDKINAGDKWSKIAESKRPFYQATSYSEKKSEAIDDFTEYWYNPAGHVGNGRLDDNPFRNGINNLTYDWADSRNTNEPNVFTSLKSFDDTTKLSKPFGIRRFSLPTANLLQKPKDEYINYTEFWAGPWQIDMNAHWQYPNLKGAFAKNITENRNFSHETAKHTDENINFGWGDKIHGKDDERPELRAQAKQSLYGHYGWVWDYLDKIIPYSIYYFSNNNGTCGDFVNAFFLAMDNSSYEVNKHLASALYYNINDLIQVNRIGYDKTHVNPDSSKGAYYTQTNFNEKIAKACLGLFYHKQLKQIFSADLSTLSMVLPLEDTFYFGDILGMKNEKGGTATWADNTVLKVPDADFDAWLSRLKKELFTNNNSLYNNYDITFDNYFKVKHYVQNYVRVHQDEPEPINRLPNIDNLIALIRGETNDETINIKSDGWYKYVKQYNLNDESLDQLCLILPQLHLSEWDMWKSEKGNAFYNEEQNIFIGETNQQIGDENHIFTSGLKILDNDVNKFYFRPATNDPTEPLHFIHNIIDKNKYHFTSSGKPAFNVLESSSKTQDPSGNSEYYEGTVEGVDKIAGETAGAIQELEGGASFRTHKGVKAIKMARQAKSIYSVDDAMAKGIIVPVDVREQYYSKQANILWEEKLAEHKNNIIDALHDIYHLVSNDGEIEDKDALPFVEVDLYDNENYNFDLTSLGDRSLKVIPDAKLGTLTTQLLDKDGQIISSYTSVGFKLPEPAEISATFPESATIASKTPSIVGDVVVKYKDPVTLKEFDVSKDAEYTFGGDYAKWFTIDKTGDKVQIKYNGQSITASSGKLDLPITIKYSKDGLNLEKTGNIALTITQPSPIPSPEQGGLSGGAIAGIVVGGVVGLGLMGFGGYKINRVVKAKKANKEYEKLKASAKKKEDKEE